MNSSIETHVRMRLIRKLCSKTQSDIAEALNIAFRTYQRIESGGSPITVDHLKAFSKFLEVPINCVIGERLDFPGTELNYQLEKSDFVPSLFDEFDKAEIAGKFSRMLDDLQSLDTKLYQLNYGEVSLQHIELSRGFMESEGILQSKFKVRDYLRDLSSVLEAWEFMVGNSRTARFAVGSVYIECEGPETRQFLFLTELLRSEIENPRARCLAVSVSPDIGILASEMKWLTQYLSEKFETSVLLLPNLK